MSREAEFLGAAGAFSKVGEFDRAEAILRQGILEYPASMDLLASLGNLKRAADQRDDAALVYDHILKTHERHIDTLYARAVIELERGRDARAAFKDVMKLAPFNDHIRLGAASALHRSGDFDEAIRILEEALERNPEWLAGLQTVARLKWEIGDSSGFSSAYRRSLGRRPRDINIWASFLGLLASSLQFDSVIQHVGEARAAAGSHPMFEMIEAQALSETGRADEAERIFKGLEPISDASFIPIRLRSLLRTGRPEEAARLGERFSNGPAANHAWPLLGLAWRLSDDSRWKWLERYEDCVTAVELPLSSHDIEEMRTLLRQLHIARQHPYDQSARGGTQTIGNLFERTDPPIARLRAAVREAVAEHIGKLPPPDPAHPFLKRDRGPFRFAGSWSIRLGGGGFHVSHVHPAGWISSALHMALPAAEDGDPQAGWLALGEPPAELGLGLPPLRVIEPKEGRLVLFPSIMWHGTLPFAEGERLTAAFDVVPFRL